MEATSNLKTAAPLPLVGAHTSTQGGLHKSLEQGARLGATTIQLFTSNQRQWKGRKLNQDELDIWHHTLATTSIHEVMSHASYLINLGSNNEALLIKSCLAFEEEIHRCLALKISYLNFHPGAATGDSIENCLNRIIKSLLTFEPFFQQHTTLRLLLETTAGQGTTVGCTFEQLSYIIEAVKHIVPIGVCVDTCHIFAAGYDIRTLTSWESTLHKFDILVGLTHLYAVHVNDSLGSLGSKKDRHANLGAGAIGLSAFEIMMQHAQLQHIPKYLETPNGDTMWTKEIKLLQDFFIKLDQ